jgi:hypothetical protein
MIKQSSGYSGSCEASKASLSPAGKVVAFWAMTDQGDPMTEREVEREITALQAKGAPANAMLIPVQWQSPCDPN